MKKLLALLLAGLLFLPSLALAENSDWMNYYLPVDKYPPIVFDFNIYESVSGPPGGALLWIEGVVWGKEEFPSHLGLYLKTEDGEKWALNWLDIDDDRLLDGKMITAYGAYTGIAPVRTQDPNFGFMPSMCVIRYTLNDEAVNPKVVQAESFLDNKLLNESLGKYRYEVFEGKTLSAVKELLGGLVLFHEDSR